MKKKKFGLCNPETNYEFEKRLSNYVFQNITKEYFWIYKNLGRCGKNIWSCRKKQSTKRDGCSYTSMASCGTP